MPSDPNKLPSPAPFPSQALRKEREAKVEAKKRGVGRPREHAGPDDKWMARRMISFRLEHIHWHNIRWFARKDRVTKGEYIKQAIMLFNYINWHYPLNKRMLLDLNSKLELYLEFYKKILSQQKGDPLVGIQAFYEVPQLGRQFTAEEKEILIAITQNIKELKHAQSKNEGQEHRQEAVSRQQAGEEKQVSGSLAQESSGAAAGAA